MNKIIRLAMAGIMAVALCACGSSNAASSGEDKKTEAGMGETLSTMFFDVTLDNASLADSVGEVLVGKQNKFLIVDITVTNTTGSPIEMADSDFWAKWGDGDEEYDAPITAYGEEVDLTDGLPSRYTLAAGEAKSGKLVFVTDKEKTSFQLVTEDYYSEGGGNAKKGDTYTFTFDVK